MKTRSAMILSLVGVLGAGAAAGLVNTRVLSQKSSTPDTDVVLSITGTTVPGSPAVVASGATQPVVVASAGGGSAGGASTSSNSAGSATSAFNVLSGFGTKGANAPITVASSGTSSSGSSTGDVARLTSYRLGDAGVVRVESADGRVRVVDVEAGAGWRVVSTVARSATVVEVTLRSADVEVVFVAELVGDNVVTNVESESLAPATTAPTGDDDGDDDGEEDHEDEDEDEDEHEDEHEDEDEDEHEDREDEDDD